MKGKILKRLTALFAAVAITMNALPLNTLAVSGDNGGTGSSWGESQTNSTWDIDHQGYRMCIVNSSGTAVSNAVDVLYREAPSTNETLWYKTTRTGETRSDTYSWTDIGFSSNSVTSGNPPAALLWNGGPIGNGENVNTWFNANGNKILNAKSSGSYIFTFKSSTDKSLVSGGKTVKDVVQSKGYYLTVEPITWFKPSNYPVTKVYGKYVYGTIYNICAWYYNNSSLVSALGAAYGGNYSKVLHVLWQSMYVKSNIIGLTGSTSASTFTAYDNSNIDVLYTAMQTLGAGIHVYALGEAEADSVGSATCFVWYGTKDFDGNISWTCSSTVSTPTAIYNRMKTSSVSKDGKVYQQYKLTKNASGQWIIGSQGTVLAVHYCTKDGKTSTPTATLNSSSYSGTHYYFITESVDDVERIMKNYSIEAVHFVFIYSPTEAEISVSYPKGTKVITPVTLYNDSGSGMRQYSVVVSGTTVSNDTRGTVTFSSSEWSSDKAVRVTAANKTSQLTWISWTTPTNKDTMTIIVTPGKGGKLLDENTGKYVDRLSIVVSLYDGLTENTPPDPKVTDTADGYNNISSQNIRKMLSTTGTGSVGSWTVQKSATVFEVVGSTPSFNTYYYSETYTAEIVDAQATITPSPYCPTWYTSGGKTYMKSGYGFYTEVTATLRVIKENRSVSYSGGKWSEVLSSKSAVSLKPGQDSTYAVSFQSAESKFPEFYYNVGSRGNYNRVLVLSKNVFSFANNKYSSLNDTVHYTPLWYPDDEDYVTVSNVYYAYTPLGSIEVKNIKSNAIIIQGNVYDDWHVAVVG